MEDKLQKIIQKVLSNKFKELEISYDGFMVENDQDDISLLLTWYLDDINSISIDLPYKSEKEFFEKYGIDLKNQKMNKELEFLIDVINQIGEINKKVNDSIRTIIK